MTRQRHPAPRAWAFAALLLGALTSSGCATVLGVAGGSLIDHARDTRKVEPPSAQGLAPGMSLRLVLRDGRRVDGVLDEIRRGASGEADTLILRAPTGVGGGITEFTASIESRRVALSDVVRMRARRPSSTFALLFLGVGIAIDAWIVALFSQFSN